MLHKRSVLGLLVGVDEDLVLYRVGGQPLAPDTFVRIWG